MADTGAPGFIPLFGDSDAFTPIQAPFNAISTALNTALANNATNEFLPYATKAALVAAPGTVVGQHASVNADSTATNNGDYKWGGSAWIQTSSTPVTVNISTFNTGWAATAGYTPKIIRNGKRREVFGAATRTTTAGPIANICTVANEDKPDGNTWLGGGADSTNTTHTLIIFSGGIIGIPSYGDAGNGAIVPLHGYWYVP